MLWPQSLEEDNLDFWAIIVVMGLELFLVILRLYYKCKYEKVDGDIEKMNKEVVTKEVVG